MQENQQSLSPQPKAQLTKSNLRSRFSKYKPMIEKAKSYNNEGSLDHIFSHFCYKPLQVEAYIKDSSNSGLERLSTFESELDCSQQQITVDQSSWSSKSDRREQNTKIILEGQINSMKPEYIQQFNRLNGIIPNHHYPNFKIKQEMGNLTLLIKSALKAIHHVFGCALRVGNKSSRINVFSASDKNKLTLNYFLNSGWQKLNSDLCISKIKPNESFKCTLDFNQILTQLDLLLSKTSRYELAASLTQQIDLNLYLKIRQNLFQIEDKLMQCSNSLYSLWNTNEYPDFYYMYLKILKCDHDIGDQERKLVIRQFRHLWQLHEPLTCSEIGRSIWEKVHKTSQNRNTTI